MLKNAVVIRDYFRLLPHSNEHDLAEHLLNRTGINLSYIADSIGPAREMVGRLQREFGVRNSLILEPRRAYEAVTGHSAPEKVFVKTFDFLLGFYLSDECFRDGQLGGAAYPSGSLSLFISRLQPTRPLPSNSFKVKLGTGHEMLTETHEIRHLLDNIIMDHRLNHFTDIAAGIYTEDFESIGRYVVLDYNRTLRKTNDKALIEEIRNFPKASVKNLAMKGFESTLLSYLVSLTEPTEMFSAIVKMDKSYNSRGYPDWSWTDSCLSTEDSLRKAEQYR